jgi:hypothetical protein
MKDKAENIKKIIKNTGNSLINGDVKPWDIVNPQEEKVSEEEAIRRFDICKACPELIKLTKQCRNCGCFMAVKTKLEKATCPIGKW